MAGRRTPLLVGATVAAALVTGCSGSSTAPDLGTNGQIAPVKDRVTAPDLRQSYIGGGTLDLAALRGHVVVLNVFGSWCPPCQAEQPGLSALSASLTTAGVKFIGVAERDNDAAVRGYQGTYHVGYPAIEDGTGGLVAQFRAIPISAIPSTLVIDKQGREAARFIGRTDAASLKPVLAALDTEQA